MQKACTLTPPAETTETCGGDRHMPTHAERQTGTPDLACRAAAGDQVVILVFSRDSGVGKHAFVEGGEGRRRVEAKSNN